MITITHLLDDAALGGVTRFLDALEKRMGPGFQHRRELAAPRKSLPAACDSDVIVVHFAMSWAKLPYLALLRARKPQTPIVIVEHGYSAAFERLHVSSKRRFRSLLRIAYALADRVVAVSYGQAQWQRQSRLLPAIKLHVIRPFTDCEILTSIAQPSPGSGPLRLGAFGRYCAQKDFATLIEAMRLVAPSTAALALRGFGDDKHALQQQARLLPHVTIGDSVGNLADFLSGTDAIAVPSAFEPFGQVALEARLAARPLIVTDIDGLPEQVEPSFGMVIRPASAHDMAAAIEAMAASHHRPEWSAMCDAARASAMEHASTSVKRWQQLLREVCGQPSTSPLGRQARAHA